MENSMARNVLLVVALVFVTWMVPTVVFLVTGIASGMGASGSWSAFLEQASGGRPNPLITGVVGLFPLLVIGVVLLVCRLAKSQPRTRALVLWGGFFPVVAVLVWSNLEFWTVFLPEKKAPGFPHGMELLIGPVFFAPVAMAFGMVIAFLVGRNKS